MFSGWVYDILKKAGEEDLRDRALKTQTGLAGNYAKER
jgi:hypothetical protein